MSADKELPVFVYPTPKNGKSRGPKVLYDGQIFDMQRAGGISRYVTEIIQGLPADWRPVLTTGRPLEPTRKPPHPLLETAAPPDYRPRRFQQLLRRVLWRPRILRDLALFHPSYYSPGYGFQLSDFTCPTVVTVYDMIYARFPKQMGGGSFLQEQRSAILRADHIICISRSTREDLIDLIPEAEKKSSVIYLAPSFEPDPGEVIPPAPPVPTFLFVGARDGYKNCSFLLRAFAAARSVRPDLRLRIAGDNLTRAELWEIHLLGLDDAVSFSPFPDERELRQLYESSSALLYPTLYEGFGLPTLEAMACGTIVVTSNTSSLPEVVGDAGFMLDPRCLDTWVSCILQIASDGFPREEMIRKGYRRCREFSWSKTVQQHVQVYQSLIG